MIIRLLDGIVSVASYRYQTSLIEPLSKVVRRKTVVKGRADS